MVDNYIVVDFNPISKVVNSGFYGFVLDNNTQANMYKNYSLGWYWIQSFSRADRCCNANASVIHNLASTLYKNIK